MKIAIFKKKRKKKEKKDMELCILWWIIKNLKQRMHEKI
jgi:hypothetical protein